MNELEILKRLINLEKESHRLKIRIKIRKNEIEKQGFIDENHQIENEIEDLKNQLKEVENKSSSAEAKTAIIRQLSEYITEINKAGLGLKLLRNQGLMLENAPLSEIYRDLHFFITNGEFGIRTPAWLCYTSSKENSIEIDVLSEFLSGEIQILRKITDPNYLKLRQYIEEFRKRIIEKFIE